MTNHDKGMSLTLEYIADTLGLTKTEVFDVWDQLARLGLACDKEQEDEVLNDIANDPERLYDV